MPARQERSETEPRHPFDRAACVRHTARTYVVYPPILDDLAQRYLPEDAYASPADQLTHFHTQDQAVANLLRQLEDPGVALTDALLKDYQIQATQARRSLGPNIAARAQELELAPTLTPSQTQQLLDISPHIDLAESVTEGYHTFGYTGWGVFPAKPDHAPVCLVPHAEGDNITFSVIHIDALHSADPEFVRSQMTHYLEAQALGSMANSVAYDLDLHRVPEAQLLPSFADDIA